MFILKKRYCKIKEQISALDVRVRNLESRAEAMTFCYGKVDFPKFAELTERDISNLKARK